VIADPLKVVKCASLNDALQQVLQVVMVEGIEEVVIGMPESGEARKITREFIKRLRDEEMKIIEVEETLSSQAAGRLMREMGAKRSAMKKEDALAAAIILQDYLESRI
jgi:RNase H-fold protein (predicted Holliday junction resolvase)